jgi:parallel beta-helix repeat protein
VKQKRLLIYCTVLFLNYPFFLTGQLHQAEQEITVPGERAFETSFDNAQEELSELINQQTDSALCEILAKLKATLSICANKETNPEIFSEALLLIDQALEKISPEQEESEPLYRSKNSRLLYQIKDILCCCCLKLSSQITAGFNDINSRLTCESTIPITTVPVVINKSGNYCITKDLVYEGNRAAISIAATNVNLNFNNHTLTLKNKNGMGVLIGANKVGVENGRIISQTLHAATEGSSGLLVISSNNVRISNMFVNGGSQGVRIVSSSAVNINNSYFNNAIRAGIMMLFARAVTIDQVSCIGNATGIFLFKNCENCQISNSTVINGSGSFFCIAPLSIKGLTIDNCLLEVTDPLSSYSIMQLGSVYIADQRAVGVIIRNSVLTNSAAVQAPGFDGLLIANASRILIENTIISINAPPSATNPLNAAIHNGYAETHFAIPFALGTDVLIQNSVLRNPLNYGLATESGTTNFTIQNSTISDSATGIRIDGTTASTVQGNRIVNNFGDGITINPVIGPNIAVSDSNSIIENTVARNDGNGIILGANTTNNLVRNNEVYTNTLAGISNSNATNQVFDNVAYNNNPNYAGIFAPGTIVAPGAPAVAGQNISA